LQGNFLHVDDDETNDVFESDPLEGEEYKGANKNTMW